MTETTSSREGLDWDLSPYASPPSAQETSYEVPSDEIITPASTTSASFVQASLPQTASPSNVPLSAQLSHEVLELISLHQITRDHYCHPIDPATYITLLEASDKELFARRLVVQIENFFELSPRYELPLQDRIQDVKQRCDFLECPRHERPTVYTLDSRGWICEIQRYERIKIDHQACPDERVELYASVCLSQSFGRLQYTLPTNMGPDGIPSAAALLISLHEERRKQYGIGSFTPTISLKLRIPGFLEDLGPCYQLQKEKNEIPATHVDWQHIRKHGGDCYIQHLRRHYIRRHGKMPRVEDVELRDYKELASMFQGHPATDLSVSQLIEGLQEFQTAKTDFEDWSKEDTPSLTWLYVVQSLAILGFKASMKDFLRDPRKVLRNIYCILQWDSSDNDHECSPETPPSSTYGRDADELPLLCPDTESLTDGEEDDTALNWNVDTDDHMNPDDCYGLLEILNDNSRYLLTRLFGVWVAIQERKVKEGRIRRADECILRAWRTLANLVLSSGLNGAISTIESQLPRVPLSRATVLERVCHCERELGMKKFSFLQAPLPDTWMPLNKAVELLWEIPRFKPKDVKISKVLSDQCAVRVFLAGCAAKLGYILPKNQLRRGYEMSNKVLYNVRR